MDIFSSFRATLYTFSSSLMRGCWVFELFCCRMRQRPLLWLNDSISAGCRHCASQIRTSTVFVHMHRLNWRQCQQIQSACELRRRRWRHEEVRRFLKQLTWVGTYRSFITCGIYIFFAEINFNAKASRCTLHHSWMVMSKSTKINDEIWTKFWMGKETSHFSKNVKLLCASIQRLKNSWASCDFVV